MIETRLLHYFLAIAREQNITKAAAMLHLGKRNGARDHDALRREDQ